jgi:ATP-dependent helicase/DNAse subunit B
MTIRTLRRQAETLCQYNDLRDDLFYPLAKFSKGAIVQAALGRLFEQELIITLEEAAARRERRKNKGKWLK